MGRFHDRMDDDLRIRGYSATPARATWKALTERLGVSGAIRFLMEYDPGRGDYVEERRELFRDLTLDEAVARAMERSGGRASP